METGVSIQCRLGDLTKSTADLVVNAANAAMQHASGLSGQIKKFAGQQIQDDSNDYVKNFGKVPAGSCIVTLG